MLTPNQFHSKHHKIKGRTPSIDTCKRCVIAKVKCASKQQFKSRKIAHKKALSINIDRNWWPDSCLYPYRCRYCECYHLTTADTTTTLRRVDKMHREWMRRTGQKTSLWSFISNDGEAPAA